MPIPELVDGVLEPGMHECTIDEVSQVFGYSGRTDARARLAEKLRQFVADAKLSAIVAAIVVDGSYITAKERPSDVDLIVALRADFDLGQELRPFEYNIRSKRMIRQLYRFDAFVVVDGSEEYARAVSFFSRVKATDPAFKSSREVKGLLRIVL